MTSFPASLRKIFAAFTGAWLLILMISMGVLRANVADPGTYPLKLSGSYPDGLLFNADYYHFKRVQDLYPDALMKNTDQYFTDRQNSLKELGMTPFLYYWADFLGNPFGGVSQSAVWTQLLVVGAKIHLESLGWEGGTLIISVSDGAGNNLAQSVENIFTPAQAQSFQTFANNALYLRQILFDGTIEFRLGRFSSASVFASLPAMGSLPVSGAVNGTPTSLFTNLSGWHSNGKPSWAAYTKAEAAQNTYIKAAVLEVNPQANDINYHGFDMAIGSRVGTLLLTELGWTPTWMNPSNSTHPPVEIGEGKSVNPTDERTPSKGSESAFPSIYMTGAYLQNFAQTQFDGQVQNEVYGFYWQGQQMIWRNRAHPKQNLSLWGGMTYSPQTEVALIPVMGYGGIYCQGLISGREHDISMLNFYTGSISGAFAQQNPSMGRATQESIIEVSHIIQLTDHFQLQPDLQWIIQSGGNNSTPNALIIGFQIAAQF